MSYSVGRRCGSDPVLLWLWCRPAAAALIQSLALKRDAAVVVMIFPTKLVFGSILTTASQIGKSFGCSGHRLNWNYLIQIFPETLEPFFYLQDSSRIFWGRQFFKKLLHININISLLDLVNKNFFFPHFIHRYFQKHISRYSTDIRYTSYFRRAAEEKRSLL